MGCFQSPPPWRKTAPVKRPIKRSWEPIDHLQREVSRALRAWNPHKVWKQSPGASAREVGVFWTRNPFFPDFGDFDPRRGRMRSQPLFLFQGFLCIFGRSPLLFRNLKSGVAPANQTKGQFMNFPQGHSRTKVQCESCLFSWGKTPEFTKMSEIHELFVLPLSLVWFAGATTD